MTIFEKKQSFNEVAVVLIDYEMKVIELIDWTIDAPVENNPCILICGRIGYARKANNQFRGDVEKSTIT